MSTIRRIFAVILCFCALSLTAYAQPDYAGQAGAAIITPYYTYINSATNSMSISNDVASCSALLRATSQVNKVEIMANLQRYQNGSWTTIASFSKSSNSSIVSLSETHSVTAGYSYRLVTTYNVYISGILRETTSDTYSYGYYG